MSYSHTAGLVWVIVSQQDCCELQSYHKIGSGYSQAAGLFWFTVKVTRLCWVTVRLQDCFGLWSCCRIVLGNGHSGHSQATTLFQVTARLGTSAELHSGCKTALGYTQAARSVWGMVTGIGQQDWSGL